MRDIFEDIFQRQPLDPTEAARQSMRPHLRRRFYAGVDVVEQPGGFAVALDGRPVRTPARRMLAAPTRALAQAFADEWQAQRDVIDSAAMPLTRLANAIIDGVIHQPEPVAAEIEKYLGSDLLCYRAADPAGLVARHAQHWDPVVEWARTALGARFVLAEGIAHVAQPEQTLAAARAAIPGHPWALGAVNAITGLTGSALLALAVAQGRLSAAEAWTAAHVDEDWNMEQWGRDEQEIARRALREAEMTAAATVLALLGR